MIGGVCGHAGLFSNANDLAKLMQMYLQMGKYGGEQYIQPGTVKYFTTPAYPKTSNRRALGFDKPGMGKKSPVTKLASPESFGHTGFTGTVAWVDPKQQFVFVFLSNRINPSTDNNKINQLNIRTKIHEIFYQSFN
jgi:CubicO group peptidase (beta-lactamase class C family)